MKLDKSLHAERRLKRRWMLAGFVTTLIFVMPVLHWPYIASMTSGIVRAPEARHSSLDMPANTATSNKLSNPGSHANYMHAAAAANLSHRLPQLGRQSTKWQPLVFSSCLEGMPQHWAPCIVGKAANPTLAVGEELLYPAFSIPEPGFIKEEDATWWRTMASDFAPDRYHLRAGRAIFADQHGQNLLLKNVRFRNAPVSDVWADNACMSSLVSHRALQPLPAGELPSWGRVVLVNSPDSWSFQHFTDRAVNVLLQSEGWQQAGTHLVGGRAPTSSQVLGLWHILAEAGGRQEVHFGVSDFTAEELVFSCRAPLTHPYMAARLAELVQLPAAPPLEQRKVVLYFSRNTDALGNRGVRKVLNEDAVLEAIREVLAKRNRGEELVVFDAKKFPNLTDVTALMTNVMAIVGPHGGALHNAWWAAPETLLLELYPTSYKGTVFWECGSIRGLIYWLLRSQSDANQNITPDPALVARILREQLGKRREAEEPRLHSEWAMSELL